MTGPGADRRAGVPFDRQYVDPVPAQEQRRCQADEAAADDQHRDLVLRHGRSGHLQCSLRRCLRRAGGVTPYPRGLIVNRSAKIRQSDLPSGSAVRK
jgi:hypothetical protein